MCGIAGIISSTRKPYQAELQRMGEALGHRGPDDEGFFTADQVGFVHKRLSIIDLITGRQPMSNDNSTVTVVFNGEIYNYLELRLELINKGHHFITSSDTEVLLHLYEEYGTGFLSMLNGMFAFAIFDQNDDRIFAARDHFGIKPFYYVFNKDEFVFASEPKAILSIRPEYCQPDEKALYDYVMFQFCLHEKTFFRGINKLLPGYYLVVDHISSSPSIRVNRYWDIEFSLDREHTEEYFIDKLMMLLQDSVRLQLRSDVPIGFHLSGGLDSSTITCIASRLNGIKMKTFTGAFDDGLEYDETEFAREVSRFAQTEYFEIRPTAQDFAETISEIIYRMDEPSAGPGVFPQYFVSKLASRHVKVILGGQGGDELFGGYARYLVAYLEQCLKGAILETNEEGKFVVTLDSIIPNLPVLREYTPLLQSFFKSGLFEDMDRRYFQLINRSPNSAQYYSEDLLSIGHTYDSFETFCEIFNAPDTKSYINKMTYFDMKTLLPALLHVEDRTSMSFSLESRVPLLDHRIVELMATIPPNIKWKGGQSKYLFRRAVETLLPGKVMNRKDKKGFPVPLSKWMQGELKGFTYDILLSKKARERGVYNMQNLERAVVLSGKYDRELWGLLCMELWYQRFID